MLTTGITFSSTTQVDESNTARTMKSGDMDVFATPAMVALMENAAMCAVTNDLPEGSSTVGAQIHTSHIKPSAQGETITATATLIEVDRRKLTFKVEARDSQGPIGEGTHIRFIVEREKFLAKL